MRIPVKAIALARNAQPAVERFPRSQKFLLGDRIQRTALDVLESLIDTTYTRHRYRHVLRYDVYRYFPTIDHEILKRDIRRGRVQAFLPPSCLGTAGTREPHIPHTSTGTPSFDRRCRRNTFSSQPRPARWSITTRCPASAAQRSI